MAEVNSDEAAVLLIERINNVVIENLGVEPGHITPESEIESDLGADSLDVIELTMAVEETFDIEIADDEAEKVKTMDDLYGLIARKVTPPSDGQN